MSKAFTISENATQLGKLWLCRRCIRVFKLNLPYWYPTPGVDTNFYLTPCVFMVLNASLHRMLLNIFARMYTRVTPRHLLGSYKTPLFGTGTIWTSCHLSISVSSIKYLLKKSIRWVNLSSLIALKIFGGTFLVPSIYCLSTLSLPPLVHPVIWFDQFLAWYLFVLLHIVQTSQMGDQRKRLYQSVVLVPRNYPHPMLRCFHWVVSSLWWWDFRGGFYHHQIGFLTFFHASLGFNCMEWIISA